MENPAFQELQSEPAELKRRKGADGRAATPAGLCKLRSSCSQPADLLHEELPAGKGRDGLTHSPSAHRWVEQVQ